MTISNGIDLSPDGRLAYYDDTPTGRTDVFDVVDGELVNRRPFVTHDVGHPDGLTVDSAGNVWVALNGAGRVRCFSPSGELLAEVTLPVRLVTACTFGGDDLRDLYVTSSRENLEDPEPEAGALSASASPCRVFRCAPSPADERPTATEGVCRVPGSRDQLRSGIPPSVDGPEDRNGAGGPRDPAGRHTRSGAVEGVLVTRAHAQQAPGGL